MVDAPSVTTFVVGDRLPWQDISPGPDEKGPFDAAAIYHSGIRQDCEIRKISALGAMVASNLNPALGDRVAIELATGQRPQGKIAWVRRGELGVRFEDAVDVVALLNRKLVSQTPERRTMPRIEVRCIAHLKFGGRFWPAMLRNISSGGLQIEGEELPAIGTFVSVFVEGLNIPAGEIVWKSGNLGGVELLEELSWTSIIPWVRNAVRKTAQ
ncbi:MAG TPA: PilZ domain-containing protein [Sphingomicrobium sp.]